MTQDPRPKAVGTTQIDNERTRITHWHFEPGAETGEHIHEFDYAVVPVTTGTLTLTNPEGAETKAELQAGISYFREKGVHHNVINANAHVFAFIEVEFK